MQLERHTGTDQIDTKKDLRQQIDRILPDSLMIALALVMVPVVVIPLVFDLPASVTQMLRVTDYTIVAIFVAEYVLKLASASDVRKHLLSPWRLLDLLIILLAFLDLLQFIGTFGRWSPVLRVLRVSRIIAAGSRAVDRRIENRPSQVARPVPKEAINVRVVDKDLSDLHEAVSLGAAKSYLQSASQTWIDISSVMESDLPELSSSLGIPMLVLESELVEESYPRIDYFEGYSMIVARIANLMEPQAGARRVNVARSGLLVICSGQNIITISRAGNQLFSEILTRARKLHGQGEPLVVSVLFATLKFSLEKDSQVITTLEHELIALEGLPLNSRPARFLENTFHLRKEVNQLVPSLLHMKEIAAMITSRRVPLEGFQDSHVRLFDILGDEATYLKETAENVRDNLLSLIDLYINTSSFEMNKVMRLVAVITSLGIIPAVAGMFGSNFVGNPWNFQLWQLFVGVAALALCALWVFYRLGWLKG